MFQTIAIAATAVALCGLISYCRDARSVNLGAFLFPALIAAWAWRRNGRK